MLTNKFNHNNFFFTDHLNEAIEYNIKKFKNLSIIFKNNYNQDFNLKNFIKIKKFCARNKIKLYMMDDFKTAIKLKTDGIYYSSTNNKIDLSYKNSFKIIGSAHSQREYYFKKKQGCEYIFFSPLFKNIKYSDNQILNPIKFNLMSLHWKVNLIALGGINTGNFKKVYLTKSQGIAFISWMKTTKIKKPVHFNNVRAL
jgi:thiamine monophosphate synthase